MPVRGLLHVASWIYGVGVVGRLGLYRFGLLKGTPLSAPVISIGNITVGGTGKTPFVMLLVQEIRNRGLRPAVVLRGYGGKQEGRTVVVSDGEAIRMGYPEVGDEALLLARKLSGVPIVMSADRLKGCEIAIRDLGAQVALLDDGFQHLRVERDLDIILLDRENPFGFGYLLPRGLLREPLSALRRADLFVMTGTGGGEAPRDVLARLRGAGSTPLLHAVYVPAGLTNVKTGTAIADHELYGQTVLAFSGIGNPQVFQRTLESLGILPKHHVVFSDHHPYTASDLNQIGRSMEDIGATVALTTEKDAVRLEKLDPPFPLVAVGVRLSLTGGQTELKRCLDGLFP